MRVLFVVHGYPPSGTGGAEIYAESIATRLARLGDDVFVLAREHQLDAPEFRVRREHREGVDIVWLNNTFRTTASFADTYCQPAIDAIAARVIDEVRPDVAHVHHLTGLSTGIVDELARRAIPVVLTLHDYWLLCHRGQLVDESLRPCAWGEALASRGTWGEALASRGTWGEATASRAGCSACTGIAGGTPGAFAGARLLRALDRQVPAAAERLRKAGAALSGAVSDDVRKRESSRLRLDHMRERFGKVTVALAPSQHVRRRFESAGFPPSTMRVSEYGVEVEHVAPTRREGPLRLGYLGALMVSKAPHILAEAVQHCGPGVANAHFFGAPVPYHGDRRYSEAIVERLSALGATVHGPVPHEEVARVFEGIDALVFPSVWEETSGIGAREALAAGVPVVASRIGGIPESIRDGINGLLFRPGDARDLARLIRRLAGEPGLLDRLRAGCTTPRTLDDDVSATRAIYDEVVAGNANAREHASERVAAVVLNYRTPDQTALAAQLLVRSTTPVDVIVVDNGDGAECRGALAPVGDRLTFHATGANLGFSGGCNAGIGKAISRGADLVWLVNSDVLVPPDALDRLMSVMHAHPDIGILGPVVFRRGWANQIASAGLDYDIATGRMRERRAVGASAVIDVPAVSGCAMLVRRAVFDAVGPLPEDYFFGFEDIAFCYRATDAGFRVAIASAARVFHDGGASSDAAADRLYYAARNHLRLGRETPARSLAHRAARQLAILSFNVAHVATSRDGSLPARVLAVAEGVFDHARGRYGPR